MRFAVYNPNQATAPWCTIGTVVVAPDLETATAALAASGAYPGCGLVDSTYYPVNSGHVYHTDTGQFSDFLGTPIARLSTPLE